MNPVTLKNSTDIKGYLDLEEYIFLDLECQKQRKEFEKNNSDSDGA